ncbi:PRC-barrel domain-containing protein [Sphingomonas sp. MMS24-J13]|uniref:PRC-barrel domain-containing protein n=1 Tax=Sphingomonas sp. MMS24-J13 TaxID=3238686 RepID=UPI0038515088
MSNPVDAAHIAEPTNLLLASNKVDGTKVASRDGDALGSIYSLMINKRSGAAAYAILSVGGFLGIGRSYYPLPFELLSYDPVADGFIVTIDRRLLEGGPSWANNPPDFNQAYADRVSNYYGVAPTNISIGEAASGATAPQ